MCWFATHPRQKRKKAASCVSLGHLGCILAAVTRVVLASGGAGSIGGDSALRPLDPSLPLSPCEIECMDGFSSPERLRGQAGTLLGQAGTPWKARRVRGPISAFGGDRPRSQMTADSSGESGGGYQATTVRLLRACILRVGWGMVEYVLGRKKMDAAAKKKVGRV